jgi:hypothetical protein
MARFAGGRKARQINSERLFFAGMAALVLLVVLLGFGPKFYFLPFTGEVRDEPYTWGAIVRAGGGCGCPNFQFTAQAFVRFSPFRNIQADCLPST